MHVDHALRLRRGAVSSTGACSASRLAVGIERVVERCTGGHRVRASIVFAYAGDVR